MPGDFQHVRSYFKQHPDRVLIVKPSAGAQGKGISLVMHADDINPDQDSVVQTYVDRPFLLNGYKFDLRIYVLVTCCEPLRVYIFEEGLVRICTSRYEYPNPENMDNAFQHLTNYSVNKHNESFVQNDGDDGDNDDAKKQSLQWLWKYLDNHGHDAARVRTQIADVVVKTLIAIQPTLSYCYHACKIDPDNRTPFTCFEILGFDIILNEKLEAILLEVNHTPSYATDSKFDYNVKSRLIRDTLNLLQLSAHDRLVYQKQVSRRAQIRLYGEPLDKSRDHSKHKGKSENDNKSNSDGINHKGGNQWGIERDDKTEEKSSGECSPSRKKDKFEVDGSVETMWTKYLKHEKDNMGGFTLIYPPNVYENQPTNGKEQTYTHLLDLAAVTYYIGIGQIKAYDTTSARSQIKEYVDFITPEPKTKRALVVDDSVSAQKILVKLLVQLGYTTDVAGNGKTALRKIIDTEPCKYDIIFMDILMPKMDGITTTKIIRDKFALEVPIIAVTSLEDIKSLRDMKEVGINMILKKPPKANEVMAGINEFVVMGDNNDVDDTSFRSESSHRHMQSQHSHSYSSPHYSPPSNPEHYYPRPPSEPHPSPTASSMRKRLGSADSNSPQSPLRPHQQAVSAKGVDRDRGSVGGTSLSSNESTKKRNNHQRNLNFLLPPRPLQGDFENQTEGTLTKAMDTGDHGTEVEDERLILASIWIDGVTSTDSDILKFAKEELEIEDEEVQPGVALSSDSSSSMNMNALQLTRHQKLREIGDELELFHL